jgi:hypothetical protein
VVEINMMEDYLKALDGSHNPASVEDGFSSLPDGKYHVRLDKLYFNQAKTSGRSQCVWEFDIIDGQYAFRKIFKFSGMDTGDNLDFLTRDLRRAGIENFKWSTVQEQFKNVLDKLFEVELKTKKTTKGEFQSIYIQKQLKSDEVMLSKTIAGQPPVNGKVPF